jgi:hypothetical protein
MPYKTVIVCDNTGKRQIDHAQPELGGYPGTTDGIFRGLRVFAVVNDEIGLMSLHKICNNT